MQEETLEEYKANPKWAALGPRLLTECAEKYCHVTPLGSNLKCDCGNDLTLMPIEYASAVPARYYDWFAMEEKNDVIQNMTRVRMITEILLNEMICLT